MKSNLKPYIQDAIRILEHCAFAQSPGRAAIYFSALTLGLEDPRTQRVAQRMFERVYDAGGDCWYRRANPNPGAHNEACIEAAQLLREGRNPNDVFYRWPSR